MNYFFGIIKRDNGVTQRRVSNGKRHHDYVRSHRGRRIIRRGTTTSVIFRPRVAVARRRRSKGRSVISVSRRAYRGRHIRRLTPLRPRAKRTMDYQRHGRRRRRRDRYYSRGKIRRVFTRLNSVPHVSRILPMRSNERYPQVSMRLQILLSKYRGRPYRQRGSHRDRRSRRGVSRGFMRTLHQAKKFFFHFLRDFPPWGSDNSQLITQLARTSGTGRGEGVAAPVTVLWPCEPTSF